MKASRELEKVLAHAESRLAPTGSRRPTEVLRKAVKGMMPRNRLSRAQLGKLKIYAGPTHPHEAQAPEQLEVD